MDKIDKALQKLSARERSDIKDIFLKLTSQNFKELNVKKLRGKENIFRVRKGNIRFIYRLEGNKIFILSVSRRRENTYKL